MTARAVAPTVDQVSHLPFLTKGTRLSGDQYSVGDVLGQGGFGITYRAGDLHLRRYVAIKEFFPPGARRQGPLVLAPDGVSPENFSQSRRSFLAEARTLARFSHPGIVRVYGSFEENQTAYMVMELIDGHSLSHVLRDGNVLPESVALSIATQVGEALQAVHEAGLLHRDINPQNILLTGQAPNFHGAVLIDFGNAREISSDKTAALTTLLTPGYAPLEQYSQQARFGPPTDIFSLAGTLYHALTGHLPVLVTDRLTGIDLPTPQHFTPQISDVVSQAVMHALQIKAADRPQDLRAFLDELRGTYPVMSQPTSPIQNPTSSTASPVWPSTVPPVSPPISPPNFNSQTNPEPNRKTVPWVAIGICSLVVLVLGGIGLSTSTPSNPTPAPLPTVMPTPLALTFPTTPPVIARLPPTPAPWRSSRVPSSRSSVTFADVDIYDQCAYAIKHGMFDDSAAVVIDSYSESSSQAGYEGSGVYWATGRLSYFGSASSIPTTSGRVILQGREEPRGYTLGEWNMRLRYNTTGTWTLLSAQVTPLP